MKIANAPCSWGVLEFDLQGKSPDYTQVLDEMYAIGYRGTELGDWGFMPTDPAQLRDALAARELTLLGAFVPVALADAEAHAAGEASALQHARLLADVGGDAPFIVLSDDNGTVAQRTHNAGRICPEHGMTQKEWDTFVAGVHRIAQSVRDDIGLRTVFHHHCAGYVETPAEVDTLMQRTDPNLVGLCFDTGHYRFGGGDPLDIFDRHAERIWHVHFKDCHPEIAARSRKDGWDYFESVENGVFCELGKGDVDFPAFIAELRNRNYDGWIVVEQDVLPGMGSPYQSAKRNYQYLKSIIAI
ncbi:MAG: TIM barrel protein [Candidatus Poribacteria bacterium]|nr:TIM barrel protein [Candidatus Poribacteria bacterium]